MIAHISSTGFYPQFGARPIAHDPEGVAEPRLSPGQAQLSKQIVAGTLETAKAQVIDVFDGKIVLRKPIHEKENGKKVKARV